MPEAPAVDGRRASAWVGLKLDRLRTAELPEVVVVEAEVDEVEEEEAAAAAISEAGLSRFERTKRPIFGWQ